MRENWSYASSIRSYRRHDAAVRKVRVHGDVARHGLHLTPTLERRRHVGIPVIEQVKIQAQVLVPLVKALQVELGEERANALVRNALGDVYRRLGEEWWRAKESRHLGENVGSVFAAFAKGDALDYTVRAQSQDAYEIDVTGCRYAQFYKELGEPELGFLLICSADFTFAEGFGADIKLTRTQTIMQGQSHCDFRFRRQKA